VSGLGVERRFDLPRFRLGLPGFGGLDGRGVYILDGSPVEPVLNPHKPVATATGKSDELARLLFMHINQHLTVRAIGPLDIHFDFH